MKRLLIIGFLSVSSLLGSAAARAQDNLPFINVATGPKDGNYEFAWIQIAKQAAGSLHGRLKTTKGSMENLECVDHGECDVALAQLNAFNIYQKKNPTSALTLERGRVLYPEYVHFICNTASGVRSLSDLKAGNVVLIGDVGSGANITWEDFREADPQLLGKVQTLPIGDQRAAGQVQEGSDATCMFAVFGLKAPLISRINSTAKTSGDRMRIVTATDSKILAIKDPKGRPVYESATIPGGTYDSLQHGFFTTAVSTMSVPSILIANTKWVEAHADAYNRLLDAINRAMPAINQRVNPE